MKESDIQNIASSVMGQLTSAASSSSIKGCGGFSDNNPFECMTHFECNFQPYLCGGDAPFNCFAEGFECWEMFQCSVPTGFICDPGNWFVCYTQFYCPGPPIFECIGQFSR